MRKLILFICLTLLFGCTRSNPKDVLSMYLDASLHSRYEEAYSHISSGDKAVKSLEEYSSAQEDNPFAQAFVSKISYEIKDVSVTGNRAKANVEITMPDLSGMFMDVMGAAFASAFGDKHDEKEIERRLAEKYKNKDMPMTTRNESFTLVKEKGGWKVFLDWEKEKKEAEQKKKVDLLLAEARHLKEQKKLHNALNKYEEVLELDSEMVEAKKAKAEIEKEIEAFEEKRSYISNVELKEFKVGKGRRYSFEGPQPAIFGKVVNHGNRTLRKVEVTVYFLGRDGQPIAEEDYYPVLVTEFSFGDDNKPLRPGYIKEFGYVVGDKTPSEWSGKARAKITDIDFQ